MKISESQSSDAGFTLVEIIASIVLLGIIILAFMPIFPNMLNWSNASEKELVASNLSGKVAQTIYDRNQQFAEHLSGKNVPLCGKDYTALVPDLLEDLNGAINGTQYTVRWEACQDDLNLYRIHFVISNDQNKRTVDSFAYVQADRE